MAKITFGDRLKALIKLKHTNQRDVAKRGGIVTDTVNRAANAETFEEANFRSGTFEGIAKGLGVSVEELHRLLIEPDDGLPEGQYHDPLQKSGVDRAGWIPRIGKTAAGKPSDFELNPVGDRDIPGSLYHAPQEGPAAIIADGDSMDPLIKNGDLVIIARKFYRQPQTGDIVAVSLVQDRGHTIKRLHILPDGSWLLKPANVSHPEVTYKRSDIRAAAVVVGWYHAEHHPRKGGGDRTAR